MNRTEVLQSLITAEKLLAGRDLEGSRLLAARARESDPALFYANQIVAVADILFAGDTLIGGYLPDLYAVLKVPPPPETVDHAVVLKSFRRLSALLDHRKNNLPFSEPASRVLHDAWWVLSNPSKKALYDDLLTRHHSI